MSLEAFYPHDVCNALPAAEQASNAALQATGSEGDPFAEGYWAALVTIALAFGLTLRLDVGARAGDVRELTLPVRGLLGDDRRW